MKRFIPFFILLIFIGQLIFLADSNQQNWIMSIADKVKFGDKIGHFILYGGLAYFLNNALKFKVFQWKNMRVFRGSIIILIFTIVEEFSQLTFASRTFDLIDIVFSLLGIYLISNAIFRSFVKRIITRIFKISGIFRVL